MTTPQKCHADRCSAEARYSTKVGFMVAAPGNKYPVRTHCSICVCEKHRDEDLVKRYLLQPQNRETITTAIMEDGHPEPDFFTLQVIFEPLDVRNAALLRSPPIKCDRADCTKIARWQIEQLFRMIWQKGKGRPSIKVLTNLCVCDEHKALARPADLRDKKAESKTRGWLAARGVSLPDFKTMELGFVPINDGRKAEPRVWVGEDGPLDQFKEKAK